MSSHHPFILSLHPGRGNLITSPLSSSSPMEPLLNPSPRFWSRPSSSRHRRRRSARAAKMGVRLSPTRPDDVPRGPPLLTAPADPRRSTKLPPHHPPPPRALSPAITGEILRQKTHFSLIAGEIPRTGRLKVLPFSGKLRRQSCRNQTKHVDRYETTPAL